MVARLKLVVPYVEIWKARTRYGQAFNRAFDCGACFEKSYDRLIAHVGAQLLYDRMHARELNAGYMTMFRRSFSGWEGMVGRRGSKFMPRWMLIARRWWRCLFRVTCVPPHTPEYAHLHLDKMAQIYIPTSFFLICLVYYVAVFSHKLWREPDYDALANEVDQS